MFEQHPSLRLQLSRVVLITAHHLLHTDTDVTSDIRTLANVGTSAYYSLLLSYFTLFCGVKLKFLKTSFWHCLWIVYALCYFTFRLKSCNELLCKLASFKKYLANLF